MCSWPGPVRAPLATECELEITSSYGDRSNCSTACGISEKYFRKCRRANGSRWMNDVRIGLLPQFCPMRIGEKVDQREQLGFGIEREQRGEHVLAAAPGVEPVVD